MTYPHSFCLFLMLYTFLHLTHNASTLFPVISIDPSLLLFFPPFLFPSEPPVRSLIYIAFFFFFFLVGGGAAACLRLAGRVGGGGGVDMDEAIQLIRGGSVPPQEPRE